METKITALIAEDVELMSRLLRIGLLSMNCSVIKEIQDGSEVVRAVEDYRPEMVFLDIQLPGMNGLDVLQELKNHDPCRFVVIVSGHDTAENLRTALDRGADGFLVKPYTNLKLKEMLETFKHSRRTKIA
jgi:two-component system chemotaxis response regulator CheY